MPISNRTIRTSLLSLAATLFAASAFAATVTGTVTNRTTGKPSSGDAVTLVAPMSGMTEVAHTSTDASGHYSLNTPDSNAYLVRVTHQGTPFLIAAPENGGPGDVSVYDVAAKVPSLSLVADVYEVEAQNGQLSVNEQFVVSNTSTPPRTQFSNNTFEVVLPANAVVDEASATRPGGLPTTVDLKPLSQKNHYTINVPIQPDQGGQETEFVVHYHMPYSGQATISPTLLMPSRHEMVVLPKDIKFTAGSGAKYQVPTDPRFPKNPELQTYLADNVGPGDPLEFTVSGNGLLPREQPQGGDQSAGGTPQASSERPGGGLGAPEDPNATNDPWSKYKWWIVGILGLGLAAGAGVMLKNNPAHAAAGSGLASAPLAETDSYAPPAPYSSAPVPAAAASAAAPPSATPLLQSLKDELFALETDRLAGRITPAEYAEHKAAFDVVLRRALSRIE